jgi:hypothetical protein
MANAASRELEMGVMRRDENLTVFSTIIVFVASSLALFAALARTDTLDELAFRRGIDVLVGLLFGSSLLLRRVLAGSHASTAKRPVSIPTAVILGAVVSCSPRACAGMLTRPVRCSVAQFAAFQQRLPPADPEGFGVCRLVITEAALDRQLGGPSRVVTASR